MGSLRRILALMYKEFLSMLKDRKSRFVVIGPPLIQLLVFGYGASYDLENVPLAVLDQADSAASRELIARFTGSPTFELTARLQSGERIPALLDARRVLMVLHIGPDFTRALKTGETARVQLIVDGRNSNTALIILNYAQSIIEAFNRDWREQRGLPLPPAELQVRAWFNPNLESRWFFVPGVVGLVTLVVTLITTSLSVAREREQGTFDQLLVTPLSPPEILAGKALPGMVIGIFEATFALAIAVFWFEIPLRGSLATLYLGLLLFLLSAVGVGLMISSLSVTQQQGLLGAFLFLVPAVILSGFATPIENMPPAVQAITLVDPLRYFLVVARGVFLEGLGIVELSGQLWPMAAIGLVSLTLAGWAFRRRLY